MVVEFKRVLDVGERSGSIDWKEQERTFEDENVLHLYLGGDRTRIYTYKFHQVIHFIFVFIGCKLWLNLEKKIKMRQRSEHRSKIIQIQHEQKCIKARLKLEDMNDRRRKPNRSQARVLKGMKRREEKQY